MGVHFTGDGSVLVQGFSPNDPRKLRREFYELLSLFDGTRPWREVVASIEQNGGTPWSDDLVAMLFQHRLLIDPLS
jgi:hypothetical protein